MNKVILRNFRKVISNIIKQDLPIAYVHKVKFNTKLETYEHYFVAEAFLMEKVDNGILPELTSFYSLFKVLAIINNIFDYKRDLEDFISNNFNFKKFSEEEIDKYPRIGYVRVVPIKDCLL